MGLICSTVPLTFLGVYKRMFNKNRVLSRYLVNSYVSKWHKTLCEFVTTLVGKQCNSYTFLALVPYSLPQQMTKSESSKDRKGHSLLVIVSKTIPLTQWAQECSLLMSKSGKMDIGDLRSMFARSVFEGIKYKIDSFWDWFCREFPHNVCNSSTALADFTISHIDRGRTC